MTDVLQEDGPAQRLREDSVGWLTTVRADGQPQSSPVWFIWDGASLWLRSQARAGKVRNIEANPRVSFHLADDGHGGNIITIDGAASLEGEPPELLEAYLAKYDEAIRTALQTSPEQLAADYPTTIRITPDPHQSLVTLRSRRRRPEVGALHQGPTNHKSPTLRQFHQCTTAAPKSPVRRHAGLHRPGAITRPEPAGAGSDLPFGSAVDRSFRRIRSSHACDGSASTRMVLSCCACAACSS